MLDVIDAANPPERLLLGLYAYHGVTEAYEKKLESFHQNKEITLAAHGH